MPGVRYEQEGGVVTLTLDEPATRNAISEAIVADLVAHCDRINRDMSVCCVIVTGAGGAARHSGSAMGQRPAKKQPGGRFTGEGISPSTGWRRSGAKGSGGRCADSSAWV